MQDLTKKNDSSILPAHTSQKMTFTNLPKDILGLIFSNLWRIDATGVPLTCRLFAFVLQSKRYFKRWKAFTITIQDMPNALRRYDLDTMTPSSSAPHSAVVEYDHFDTMADVLQRFISENNFDNLQNIIVALYGLDEHGVRVALPKNKRVTHALFALPQHCRHAIYCSSQEDLPPVN
jgi:hypothetical protein